MRTYFSSAVFLTFSTFFVSGCLWQTPNEATSVAYRRDGLLSLSRPVPVVTGEQQSSTNLLGFSSESLPPSSANIIISRESGTLQYGGKKFQIDGAARLSAGVSSVAHKQSDPLWYAPDSYFSSRLQEAPAAQSRDRYRRGALGNSAIFLNADTPIHSGPVSSDEIGGARLSSSDMEILFPLIEIGSKIEIR